MKSTFDTSINTVSAIVDKKLSQLKHLNMLLSVRSLPIDPETVYNLKDHFVNLAITNNEHTHGTQVFLPTPTGMWFGNIEKAFDIQYTDILTDADMTWIIDSNYCDQYIQNRAVGYMEDETRDNLAELQDCLYMLLLYFHYDVVHYAAIKNGISFYVDNKEEMFTTEDIKITKL